MKMKKLAAILALSFTPLMAHAQGFVEFSVGQASVDLGDLGATSVDDTDTTWAIGGGYMFHPNVGAEIGYRHLGEASATFISGGDVIRATAEVTGIFAGAVGRIPVSERFNIVPRAGLYLWESEGRGFLNGVQVVSADDDGTDIYFGVGASYAVSRQVDMGLAWTRFDIDGDDVDAIELKVGFRF